MKNSTELLISNISKKFEDESNSKVKNEENNSVQSFQNIRKLFNKVPDP